MIRGWEAVSSLWLPSLKDSSAGWVISLLREGAAACGAFQLIWRLPLAPSSLPRKAAACCAVSVTPACSSSSFAQTGRLSFLSSCAFRVGRAGVSPSP